MAKKSALYRGAKSGNGTNTNAIHSQLKVGMYFKSYK
jgi:hypothetical protein